MKQKHSRFLSVLLTLAMILSLLPPAARAAGEETTDPAPATGMTLNHESLHLASGDEVRLTATVPAEAPDKTLVWASSNEDIASVKDGVVTAKAAGTADVTVKTADNRFTAKCAVKVDVPITALGISQPKITLDPTQTWTLKVDINDSASARELIWSYGDVEAIAKVALAEDSLSAVITAENPGPSARLTISPAFPEGSPVVTQCEVVVSGIVFSDSNEDELAPGESAQLSFQRYGSAINVTDWEYKIVSDTSGGASVDPTTGWLTAGPNEGSVTVSATAVENTLYTDEWTIKVARGQATIHASLDDGELRFSRLSSTLNSKCLEITEQPLSYITSLSVAPSQGTLYYGYVSEGDTGNGVASSGRYYNGGPSGSYELGEIIFVPKPTFSGEAIISYNGYNARGASFAGEILLPVEAMEEIAYSTRGDAVRFQADDFNLFCQTETGRPLHYVTFSAPAARYGSLYYNYTSGAVYESNVPAGTRYYRSSNPAISNVAFVPADNYEGTFYLSYQGWDTAGTSFRGSIRITVEPPSSSEGGDITYSASAGKRVYFDEDDFSDASYDATGRQLDFVRFTSLPDSSQGTLYYIGNTTVSTGTSYYYSGSSRLLEDVSFLAADDFTGSVSIPFTGTDTRGTTFHGTVRITVSGGGSSTISYSTSSGRRVYFDAGDFSDVSYDLTGSQLNYVRFSSLPPSTRGTLYCGSSTKVSTNSSYYRNRSSRSLSDVNFLPDEDFTGTVSIPFKGTSSKGSTFQGTVEVTVTGGSASSSSLSYTVRAGQRLHFKTEDFADACYDATGRQLNYVRFTSLPASSQGTLYYDGSTKVSTSTSYYRNSSSRLLEDVSFLADDGFSGRLSIPFQGWSTTGRKFTGSVSITVERGTSSSPTVQIQVSYSTTGQAVNLRASDFSAACAQDLPAALSKVRFTAPDSSTGKLYLNYVSPAQHSPVHSAVDYTTAQLSQIAFVPKAGYRGTVQVPYTASDQRGNTCSGVMRVQVTPPSASSYFSDMGSTSWAVPAADFLRRSGIVAGVTATDYGPQSPMRRGDFILMLSRSFSFPDAGTRSFRDVPQDSYYASAIAAARSLGVVTGADADRFRPNEAVTREEAGVFLYRCLQREETLSAGTSADLARFSDWNQVSPDAVGAMGALVRRGVFAGDDQRRLNPSKALNRAEMAVILYQALT